MRNSSDHIVGPIQRVISLVEDPLKLIAYEACEACVVCVGECPGEVVVHSQVCGRSTSPNHI